MDNCVTSPRKYYVVVTDTLATQLEIESMLSEGDYSSFRSAHGSVYVEGMVPFNNASDLVERFSQQIQRLVPPIKKSDMRLVLNGIDLTVPPARIDTGVTDFTSPPPQVARCKESWVLDRDRKLLVKDNAKIVLTGIESTLLKTLLQTEDRVVSKEDLIRSIGREPDQYQGLEMCLSRLQEKFKTASQGERLFRAVRNRGYCLAQVITREG